MDTMFTFHSCMNSIYACRDSALDFCRSPDSKHRFRSLERISKAYEFPFIWVLVLILLRQPPKINSIQQLCKKIVNRYSDKLSYAISLFLDKLSQLWALAGVRGLGIPLYQVKVSLICMLRVLFSSIPRIAKPVREALQSTSMPLRCHLHLSLAARLSLTVHTSSASHVARKKVSSCYFAKWMQMWND